MSYLHRRFVRKRTSSGVSGGARAYGRQTLGRYDSLSKRACGAGRADALGLAAIKWRSSLFSLSTTVSCTQKCLVNHCLHSTEAAKTLIKSELSPTCHAWMTEFCVCFVNVFFFFCSFFKREGQSHISVCVVCCSYDTVILNVCLEFTVCSVCDVCLCCSSSFSLCLLCADGLCVCVSASTLAWPLRKETLSFLICSAEELLVSA